MYFAYPAITSGLTALGYYFLYRFIDCVSCTDHSQAIFFLFCVAQIGVTLYITDLLEKYIRQPESPSLAYKMCDDILTAVFIVYIAAVIFGGILFGIRGDVMYDNSLEQDFEISKTTNWNAMEKMNE